MSDTSWPHPSQEPQEGESSFPALSASISKPLLTWVPLFLGYCRPYAETSDLKGQAEEAKGALQLGCHGLSGWNGPEELLGVAGKGAVG